MYKVTIKYTAPEAPVEGAPIWPIAPTFAHTDSYVDHIEHAYNEYPANVWDRGTFAMAESLDEFLAGVSMHPGCNLALKSAVIAEDGTYAFEVEDHKEKMLYEELGRAMADYGFEITVEAA